MYLVHAVDDNGRVDIERFRKQQWALAASALDAVLTLPMDAEEIHDAAD